MVSSKYHKVRGELVLSTQPFLLEAYGGLQTSAKSPQMVQDWPCDVSPTFLFQQGWMAHDIAQESFIKARTNFPWILDMDNIYSETTENGLDSNGKV